ncbi:hypothetical protein ED21_29241 [Erythrobacter sp. SD-21]|nr:hypothetical protein ED21_29241 [Erythrobacter sp. SD-21]
MLVPFGNMVRFDAGAPIAEGLPEVNRSKAAKMAPVRLRRVINSRPQTFAKARQYR